MRFSLRNLSRLSLSALLLLSSLAARAQMLPAEDFFNRGAQSYISNNIPDALSQVELGLKTYPDDVNLKKLDELLKQKQQQQQQQQKQQQDQKNQDQKDQSQSQKSDDKKDQSQKDQQKQDQKKSDEQKKKDDEQKKQQGQKPEDEKKDGDKPQPEKPDDKKGDQDAAAQPVKAGQMKPEEAKRLLDAQKGNEQVLQMKPQGKPQDSLHPVKDW